MKLARSTYYYRGRRTAPEKMALRERIEALCAEFPRDGYRRITHQLRAEGTVVNHKAVARLMRQHGLQVRAQRSRKSETYKPVTGPIHRLIGVQPEGFTPTSRPSGSRFNRR